MPDRGVDEDRIARVCIRGDFARERLATFIRGRHGGAAMRARHDVGRAGLVGHVVEVEDRVDRDRVVAWERKIAVPPAEGRGRFWPLTQEVVLEQLHLASEDGAVAIEDGGVFWWNHLTRISSSVGRIEPRSQKYFVRPACPLGIRSDLCR